MYVKVNNQVYRSGFGGLGGKVVLLVQADYCGHCHEFKPVFQEVADDLSGTRDGVTFATIQLDGTQPGERAFSDPAFVHGILGEELDGVPKVVKFKNGRPVAVFTGRRTAKALRAWALRE